MSAPFEKLLARLCRELYSPRAATPVLSTFERDWLRANAAPPVTLQDVADRLTRQTGRPHFVSAASMVGEDFWGRPKLLGASNG